ncbi:MAG: hypothetical protein ACREHD_27510 [Pirellulales bacterium]
MAVLYLAEEDVTRLLDVRLAIEAVEEAFRRLAAGEAMNVPRQRAKAPGIVLHSMSAAAQYLGLVGWKCYSTTKLRHSVIRHFQNPRFARARRRSRRND